MKTYIVAIFLITVCNVEHCYSQDKPLFKVIAWSDGATIEGSNPIVGMDVFNPRHHIQIPPKGYMGVITADGKVVRITRSMLAGSVDSPRESVNRLSATGAIHRPAPEIAIYPELEYDESLLSGDSLFLVIGPFRPVEETIVVHITDLFDETIVKLETTNNYIAVDLAKSWVTENTALVNVSCRTKPLPPDPPQFKKNGKPKKMPPDYYGTPHKISIMRVLKKHSPEKTGRINFDIGRVATDENRLFLESAIYLLNEAPYESIGSLLKIVKLKKATGDPILSVYYDLQFRENRLELVAAR